MDAVLVTPIDEGASEMPTPMVNRRGAGAPATAERAFAAEAPKSDEKNEAGGIAVVENDHGCETLPENKRECGRGQQANRRMSTRSPTRDRGALRRAFTHSRWQWWWLRLRTAAGPVKNTRRSRPRAPFWCFVYRRAPEKRICGSTHPKFE